MRDAGQRVLLMAAKGRKDRLNKLDPGSLLGRVVYLLDKHGLDDAAREVKRVSTVVSRAWQGRER